MWKIILLLSAVPMLCVGKSMDEESLMSVYYNPKTRVPFRVTSIENSLRVSTGLNDHSSTKTNRILRRVSYKSNGCTCQELACGCCLGISLEQFNFNREGCMNFTYDPQAFAINMDMFMNESPVFSNSISAKNPPPLCLPIGIPFLPFPTPSLELCARLFDIHTPGQNLQMCFDFETRIQQAAVLILHFDCMRMGTNGVAIVKPGDPLPSESSTESQVDSDVYDEVTEIKYKEPKE